MIAPVPVLDIELLARSHPRLRRLKVDEDGTQPLTSLHYPDSPLSLEPSPRLRRTPQLGSLQPLVCWHRVAHRSFGCPPTPVPLHSESEVHADSYHSYPQELSEYLRTVVRKYPFPSAFRRASGDLPPSGFEDVPRAGTSLAELLDPLLSLRAMRSFSASFTTPLITQSSADFLKIAAAWPGIEMFDLLMADSRADQYADLGTLASFGRQRLRLRELRIPSLKFDPNISTPVVPVGPPALHFLRVLKVDRVILPTKQFEEVTPARGAFGSD